MRLIDADALKTKAETIQTIDCWHMRTEEQAVLVKHIDNASTVDAVPVVRCKDCKWWTKQEKSIQGRCALNGTYPTGGWYCANGRREGDE